MTQSLVIRREGDRIVIEDMLVTTDYAGVLRADPYLDAADAVDLFQAGLAIAREDPARAAPRNTP